MTFTSLMTSPTASAGRPFDNVVTGEPQDCSDGYFSEIQATNRSRLLLLSHRRYERP
jgi:hypothetical protein